MKRLHVSVDVEDLEASIAFYTRLFGEAPGFVQADYARWMLDDPRANFAIGVRTGKTGFNHLGIQVEDSAELNAVQERLTEIGKDRVVDQGEVTCCYAKSRKSWAFDPQGVAWEAFLTHGQTTTYGDDVLTNVEPDDAG